MRLDALAAYTAGQDPASPDAAAIDALSDKLHELLRWMNENEGFTRSCSDENPDIIPALKNVVTAYDTMANELANAHE